MRIIQGILGVFGYTAEKAASNYDLSVEEVRRLLQKPTFGFEAIPTTLPLSTPQPDFKLDVDGLNFTITNCLLLHKLLATGQGEQVVSRRGELDGDLLSSTCEFGDYSEVRYRIGLIKFLTYT